MNSGRPRQIASCVNCRSRKVKCDRQRPSCSRCIKHKQSCSYFDGRELEVPGRRVPVEVRLSQPSPSLVSGLALPGYYYGYPGQGQPGLGMPGQGSPGSGVPRDPRVGPGSPQGVPQGLGQSPGHPPGLGQSPGHGQPGSGQSSNLGHMPGSGPSPSQPPQSPWLLRTPLEDWSRMTVGFSTTRSPSSLRFYSPTHLSSRWKARLQGFRSL